MLLELCNGSAQGRTVFEEQKLYTGADLLIDVLFGGFRGAPALISDGQLQIPSLREVVDDLVYFRIGLPGGRGAGEGHLGREST